MQSIEQYSGILNRILQGFELPREPKKLYESIDYIIELGGKRLRPLMVLMSADACGGINEDAEKMALTIELFHNFSLMHDDIMDHADLRRGRPAVHKKWDVPTAILGGDALLVKTYELMTEISESNRLTLMRLYNRTAIEVCEGQQMDMNFETQEQVTIDDYISMIQLKTAVLMGAALQMGAICSGASSSLQNDLYEFGVKLGVAFQIKDDYLDCFGSEGFGKKVGGDIIENKKTYLLLKARELANEESRDDLIRLEKEADSDVKVRGIKNLFEATGAKAAAEQAMNEYYRSAIDTITQADLEMDAKNFFSSFAQDIWSREK